MGAFVRFADSPDAWDLLRLAALQIDGVDTITRRLEMLCAPFMTGTSAIVGIFPTRTPPAVGLLFHPHDPLATLEILSRHADFCVEPHDPLLRHLMNTCDQFTLSVGCDVNGRMAVSAEASFQDRERAMLHGKWKQVFASEELWGVAHTVLDRLRNLESAHTFDGFLKWGVLSGIDHIKVSPRGAVKAYVGALPFLRGVGPAGLS